MPCHILFLASNPLTTSRLDLEEELRAIENELRAIKFRDEVKLEAGHAVRPDDLVRLLREKKPTVVHFSGHGSHEGIYLRTDDGKHAPVSAEALQRLFRERGVELVVLNACFSQEQAKAISKVVPVVVGTKAAVGDEAARRFSVAFYRTLGNGYPIKEAFRDGGDAVAVHGLDDVFCAHGDVSRVLCAEGKVAGQAENSNVNKDSKSLQGENSMPRTLRSVVPFALISLISALLGCAILAASVWKAEVLAKYDLAGNFYYVALLLFGLAVAGFLFGVLHSYAKYTGKHFGGALNLGGPIVGFFIAVILGFVLVPKTGTFAMTIFVHGAKGHQDVVIKNAGEVLLNLGLDPVAKPIGEHGQAFFPAVPVGFMGQELFARVLSEDYETEPDKKIKLDSSVYLPVRKKGGHIAGRVQDAKGNPIPGATVHVAGLSAEADGADGHFNLAIPGDRMKNELELSVRAPDYPPAFHRVVPGGNDIVITLTKAE
jgi:hypothetical protein